MPSHLPLPDSLLEDVQIDPKSPTGLSWKRSPRRRTKVGDPCGFIAAKGYFHLGFRGKEYLLHRVVYFLSTKNDPGVLEVDHIDGNPTNNCPDNLRLATPGQNRVNSRGNKERRCKFKGVQQVPQTRRYRAMCKVKGKNTHIGYYDTEEEAAKAYDRVALAEYGEFAKLNFTASKS